MAETNCPQNREAAITKLASALWASHLVLIADMSLSNEGLSNKYKRHTMHPIYHIDDWIEVVRAKKTQLGYWEWIAEAIARDVLNPPPAPMPRLIYR